MEWLKKNYERALLVAACLVLLLSGIVIFFRAAHFGDLLAAQTASAQLPAKPPGQAAAVYNSLQRLQQSAQWTYSSRSGLFVPEKHFIGADGQPATLQTTEVHPPVPNEWLEQFSLPIADGDVLEQDPDGDGFTNLDEWQGHTNPSDKSSHPDYVTKLKLKFFAQENFPLIFSSRAEDTFGINNVDPRKATQFVKVGDTIAGTHFKVTKFTEKFSPDKYGTNVDVSELTLENPESLDSITLVKERVAISPESVATFVYSWKERREFAVKKDHEFSLPPEAEIKYKLLDVQPTKAVIVNIQKPDAPILIGTP